MSEAIEAVEHIPTGDVVDFALDCLWPEPDGLKTSTELYEAYMEWCAKSRFRIIAQREFDRIFRTLAEQLGMERSTNGYMGITLNNECTVA